MDFRHVCNNLLHQLLDTAQEDLLQLSDDFAETSNFLAISKGCHFLKNCVEANNAMSVRNVRLGSRPSFTEQPGVIQDF